MEGETGRCSLCRIKLIENDNSIVQTEDDGIFCGVCWKYMIEAAESHEKTLQTTDTSDMNDSWDGILTSPSPSNKVDVFSPGSEIPSARKSPPVPSVAFDTEQFTLLQSYEQTQRSFILSQEGESFLSYIQFHERLCQLALEDSSPVDSSHSSEDELNLPSGLQGRSPGDFVAKNIENQMQKKFESENRNGTPIKNSSNRSPVSEIVVVGDSDDSSEFLSVVEGESSVQQAAKKLHFDVTASSTGSAAIFSLHDRHQPRLQNSLSSQLEQLDNKDLVRGVHSNHKHTLSGNASPVDSHTASNGFTILEQQQAAYDLELQRVHEQDDEYLKWQLSAEERERENLLQERVAILKYGSAGIPDDEVSSSHQSQESSTEYESASDSQDDMSGGISPSRTPLKQGVSTKGDPSPRGLRSRQQKSPEQRHPSSVDGSSGHNGQQSSPREHLVHTQQHSHHSQQSSTSGSRQQSALSQQKHHLSQHSSASVYSVRDSSRHQSPTVTTSPRYEEQYHLPDQHLPASMHNHSGDTLQRQQSPAHSNLSPYEDEQLHFDQHSPASVYGKQVGRPLSPNEHHNNSPVLVKSQSDDLRQSLTISKSPAGEDEQHQHHNQLTPTSVQQAVDESKHHQQSDQQQQFVDDVMTTADHSLLREHEQVLKLEKDLQEQSNQTEHDRQMAAELQKTKKIQLEIEQKRDSRKQRKAIASERAKQQQLLQILKEEEEAEEQEINQIMSNSNATGTVTFITEPDQLSLKDQTNSEISDGEIILSSEPRQRRRSPSLAVDDTESNIQILKMRNHLSAVTETSQLADQQITVQLEMLDAEKKKSSELQQKITSVECEIRTKEEMSLDLANQLKIETEQRETLERSLTNIQNESYAESYEASPNSSIRLGPDPEAGSPIEMSSTPDARQRPSNAPDTVPPQSPAEIIRLKSTNVATYRRKLALVHLLKHEEAERCTTMHSEATEMIGLLEKLDERLWFCVTDGGNPSPRAMSPTPTPQTPVTNTPGELVVSKSSMGSTSWPALGCVISADLQISVISSEGAGAALGLRRFDRLISLKPDFDTPIQVRDVQTLQSWIHKDVSSFPECLTICVVREVSLPRSQMLQVVKPPLSAVHLPSSAGRRRVVLKVSVRQKSGDFSKRRSISSVVSNPRQIDDVAIVRTNLIKTTTSSSRSRTSHHSPESATTIDMSKLHLPESKSSRDPSTTVESVSVLKESTLPPTPLTSDAKKPIEHHRSKKSGHSALCNCEECESFLGWVGGGSSSPQRESKPTKPAVKEELPEYLKVCYYFFLLPPFPTDL